MRSERLHLGFLDQLRGVAILGVYLFHCFLVISGGSQAWGSCFPDYAQRTPLQWAFLPFSGGWSGVAIFFVVSGFCIHLSHRRSPHQDFQTFYTRRFFRIYPPYLVALLLFSFVPPWLCIHLDSLRDVAVFFSHALLVHNFAPYLVFGINGSLWSIAVEVQLYLLYPLLLLVVRRWGWVGALWLTGLLELTLRLIAGFYAQGHELTVFGTTNGALLITVLPIYYWFSWSIGAAAAEVFLSGRRLTVGNIPLWLFPVLTLVAMNIRPLASLGFLLASLATLVSFRYFLDRADDPAPMSWPGHALAFVGRCSYSAYLLHEPVLLWVHRSTHMDPWLEMGLLLLVWFPFIGVAWCFYRWVELPGIELGRLFAQRHLKAVAR